MPLVYSQKFRILVSAREHVDDDIAKKSLKKVLVSGVVVGLKNCFFASSANQFLAVGGGGVSSSGPWTIYSKRFPNQMCSHISSSSHLRVETVVYSRVPCNPVTSSVLKFSWGIHKLTWYTANYCTCIL